MFSELSHHAYGVAGSREAVLPELLVILARCGEVAQGNPDFRVERHTLFGIDEARSLVEAGIRESVRDGRKIFVIVVEKISDEAQNALLKLFEEPTPRTHFFLVVPTLEMLLPTLRSRLLLLASPRAGGGEERARAAAFLSALPPARQKTVQTLLKDLEDEVAGARARILAFLDALEESAAEKGSTTAATALTEILGVKRYARDRAPSFKLLLEHLAAVL